MLPVALAKHPTHELLPLNPEHGFCLIPEPSPGDVFFDLEADRSSITEAGNIFSACGRTI
jgi:hypothetical protein